MEPKTHHNCVQDVLENLICLVSIAFVPSMDSDRYVSILNKTMPPANLRPGKSGTIESGRIIRKCNSCRARQIPKGCVRRVNRLILLERRYGRVKARSQPETGLQRDFNALHLICV